MKSNFLTPDRQANRDTHPGSAETAGSTPGPLRYDSDSDFQLEVEQRRTPLGRPPLTRAAPQDDSVFNISDATVNNGENLLDTSLEPELSEMSREPSFAVEHHHLGEQITEPSPVTPVTPQGRASTDPLYQSKVFELAKQSFGDFKKTAATQEEVVKYRNLIQQLNPQRSNPGRAEISSIQREIADLERAANPENKKTPRSPNPTPTLPQKTKTAGDGVGPSYYTHFRKHLGIHNGQGSPGTFTGQFNDFNAALQLCKNTYLKGVDVGQAAKLARFDVFVGMDNGEKTNWVFTEDVPESSGFHGRPLGEAEALRRCKQYNIDHTRLPVIKAPRL